MNPAASISHDADRLAVVCTNSYAGRIEWPCRVVGETSKRYRIRVDKPTPLPPFHLLMPGDSRLVPKNAVRFIEDGSSPAPEPDPHATRE